MNTIVTAGISLIAFVFAITFHEFCHAATAYFLGDDTGKRQGRLTLNPFAHIDPLGMIFLLFVGIGWAKPVPFNPDNFKYPRLDSILVGLAGPASNLLVALISMYGTRFSHSEPLTYFFTISVWINVMLALFNLLPIPPLDGSHFILVQLSNAWKQLVYRYQLAFFLVLILLLNIPIFLQAFFAAVQYCVDLLHKIVFGK